MNGNSTTPVPDTVQTLPFHWYHDEGIFKRERAAIFDREWLPLGPTQQLRDTGDWFATELTGASLISVKNQHDKVSVFHNVCRHRGAPIVDQDCGNSRRFVCPYHGWVYETDGRLAAAAGFECDPTTHGLIEVACEVWNGMVWACLDPEPRPLSSWLGDVLTVASRFRPTDAFEYETSICNRIAVNWKTYGDNSAEGYHLEYVHPALNATMTGNTGIKACENGEFVGFDVSYRGEGETPSDPDPTPGFWIYKFPGILLHFSATSFNLERVTPISANEIMLTRWFWFATEIDSAARRQVIEASNQVMSEDIDICKRVQKNLVNGRLEHGLVSKTREPGTVFFQQLVRNRLQQPG